MEIKETKVFRPECNPSSDAVGIKIFLDQDLAPLLPYIQGELGRARYDARGGFLKFTFQEHLAIVDHDCVAVAGFADDVSARQCAGDLLELLRDIESRRDSITPDATEYSPPSVMEVFKLLPKRGGCGKCGYPTCMAFAVALTREEAAPETCPEIASGQDGAVERLYKMLGG